MRMEQGTVELPTLNHGIHLLKTDSRTPGALHSLVLDHLLTRGAPGEAVWGFEYRTRLYDDVSQTHGALGPSVRSVELAAQHRWRTFSHRSSQYVWVHEGNQAA